MDFETGGSSAFCDVGGQLTVAILSFQGALLLLTPLFLHDQEMSFGEAVRWSNQWVHA